MQISLTLQPEKPLCIPLNYNYQLQSALYALLGEVGESVFWHDNGFGDFTKYKGFCFGKLEGKHVVDRENKKIRFENIVRLEIRSSVFAFMDSFQRAVERHPFLKLYDTRLDVIGASLGNRHLAEKTTVFEAVTPIIVHETFPDGKTYFFDPAEEKFYVRICNNLSRKYESITGMPADAVCVRPESEFRKTVTRYKGFLLTGYTGKIGVKASIQMLEFIYNTGLGEKNSQGFGFVKVSAEDRA